MPEDCQTDWVNHLRNRYTLSELKWKSLSNHWETILCNKRIQNQIWSTFTATKLVVLEPDSYVRSVKKELDTLGAEMGGDYRQEYLFYSASLQMLAGCPLAYLKEQLMLRDLNLPLRLSRTSDFDPKSLYIRGGSTLRGSVRLAARAHACRDGLDVRVGGSPTSYDSRRYMNDNTNCTGRLPAGYKQFVFDVENPDSCEPLCDGARLIRSHDSRDQRSNDRSSFALTFASERDSGGSNLLQAADVAAGWARERHDADDMQSLLHRFGEVIINGKSVKSLG